MSPPVASAPLRARRRPGLRAVGRRLLVAGCLAQAGLSGASPAAVPPKAIAEVSAFARSAAERAASAMPGVQRIDVQVGAADPRLRLAPCQRTEVRAVAGAPALGRTRVGLQCVEGEARWSISLPVTVAVWAPAWVAARAVPAGSKLEASDLRSAVVDLAGDRSPALTGAQPPAGRELQRPLAAGEPLRQSHLRTRQWFAAGDTVRVLGRGAGFTVVGSGQALGPGLDGQSARVRTESGRILTGIASGEASIEVAL